MGGGRDVRRGLEPLEFEECIVDSPEFRENLNRHEKELDHTSHQIKRIIKEVKDLMSAAKVLSTRMKQLANLLNDFNFECIGTAQTDDENVICESLRRFGAIINTIEDERDKMLTLADKHIIESLENFRKLQIGGVKENKKKFDKKTEKFCQSQERFLNMSTKKPENTIQEADASLGMHEREYIQESLSYVLRIQEVQERIKFEFVEILLAFISGWLVFYHTAHEQAEDHRDYLQDLRHKVQKTRENFEEASEKVTELKTKYMEKPTKPEEKFTKRGYLFLMEKSSFPKISLLEPFKATWTKYYCTYRKQKKEFTMLQFNQMNHSFTRPETREDEKLTLVKCQLRASEFEKRFCFDLRFKEKPGIVYTFQALSEEDRLAWFKAMDGAEPTYHAPGKAKAGEEYQLNETGFAFVRKCIEVLENRGLEDEGIYRKSGVGTRINRLLTLGMDRKKTEAVFSDEQYRDLMESNTIASALKTYLRNLQEPLMTYRYHNGFIEAAKLENLNQRVHEVHVLVHKLPPANLEMLDLVIRHLAEVAKKFEKNKMSVFNLGVVFGPTLLRPLEETVAAILDIKFNNIVINILIEHYELIFKTEPNTNTNTNTAATASPTIQATKLTSVDRSPPMRMPRTNQTNKTTGMTTGLATTTTSICGSIGRSSIYSPQQKTYRYVPKSNFTDPGMSSSLQNIPNGMLYATGTCTASNSATNGALTVTTNGNIQRISGGSGSVASTSSIKNLHTVSQSDISQRRPGEGTIYSILGVGNNGGANGAALSAHHATPANMANLRHADYLLATAAPAAATTSSSSGCYAGSGNINRISMNSNISPPTVAMRKESLYASHTGQAAGSSAGPQQHPPVQRSHMSYTQTKQNHSPVTVSTVSTNASNAAVAASTSSSNESVCDSLSSNNGVIGVGVGVSVGAGAGAGVKNVMRIVNTRSSMDYGSLPTQATQSTLPMLIGTTCGDIVPASAAPSLIMSTCGIGGGALSVESDYVPSKLQRNRDMNQIKRDLDAGTARVRTLYACMGEGEGELSFEPNQIITNVRFSHERGWLQGTLNGKTGLIPENYVEHLKSYL